MLDYIKRNHNFPLSHWYIAKIVIPGRRRRFLPPAFVVTGDCADGARLTVAQVRALAAALERWTWKVAAWLVGLVCVAPVRVVRVRAALHGRVPPFAFRRRIQRRPGPVMRIVPWRGWIRPQSPTPMCSRVRPCASSRRRRVRRQGVRIVRWKWTAMRLFRRFGC